MSVREVEAQAQRFARALVKATDEQLAAEYVRILGDPEELHFAPYFVTQLREAGLWERLQRVMLAKRGGGSTR